MSARRQASTTSLSQFAHMDSALDRQASADFCNSFWGIGDQGFDVLSRRMKGAIHTTEELRNFWKERAAIEEDYAKRLSKLSKCTLGKDEVGNLRRSFDMVKDETEKQAGYHMTLAQQIRTGLETPSVEFQTKQMSHKKIYLAIVEKQVKAKQLQESHVDKSREKYEQDCVKINSYTAQSSLVQGRDLEKIQLKLERAKQTVQANEREFANFTRAFESTAQKWEQDWKAFCDGCQDLEEARIDFMKDNMWSYANFVSTVCVADDESCERVRQSLELIEMEREIENFVNVYGTGAQIPDPPAFVNYQLPDAIPSSSSQPTFRQANFTRTSARDVGIQLHRNSTYTPQTEDPQVNTAGRGAGNARRSEMGPGSENLTRQPTQRNSVYGAQHHQPYMNGNNAGHSPSSSQNYQSFNQTNGASSAGASSSGAPIQRRLTKLISTPALPPSSQSQIQSYHALPPANDPLAEPVDPTADTYIKVGPNTYKVDPSKDPQTNSAFGGFGGSGSVNRTNGGVSPAKQNGVDPLQRQLEELQNVMSVSGNGRRNTVYRGQAGQASNAGSSNVGPGHVKGADSLQAPGSRSPSASSPSPGTSGRRDYRHSAELVVGAPSSAAPIPPQSTSPNPPTATFMIPKNTTSPGTEVVTEVLAGYHQSLPGERKAGSGSTSRRASFGNMQGPSSVPSDPAPNRHSLAVTPQFGPPVVRPASGGHAGIGAHGGQSRGNSPQPPSRAPSPQPREIMNVGNLNGQPQLQNAQNQHPSSLQPNPRRNSFIMPPSAGTPARSTSPNHVGIALDPSGRVSHDEMAQRYQMQHQQNGQATMGHQPQTFNNIPPPPQHPQSRRTSYINNAPNASTSMAPPQPMYKPATTPPPPPPHVLNVYHPPQQQQQHPPQQQQQHPQQGYVQPGPGIGQQGVYGQYPQQPPQPSYQQPQPQHQQAYAMVNAAINGQAQQRAIGHNGGYGAAPNNNQNNRLSLTIGGNGGYRASSPGAVGAMAVGTSPSPQPIQAPLPPQMQHQQMAIGHQQMVASQGQGQGRYSQSATTEDGQPILFYVKALYDYQATIEEEFDFQTGDIIAVTATPEDGWWSGELLDEARRQRGRHVFPSNFVCLF